MIALELGGATLKSSTRMKTARIWFQQYIWPELSEARGANAAGLKDGIGSAFHAAQKD